MGHTRPPTTPPDVTDDDVEAAVQAYTDTGFDSTYQEAIRAALETYAARLATRTDATRNRIGEALTHINATRDSVGDLARLRAAALLLEVALDELPATEATPTT